MPADADLSCLPANASDPPPLAQPTQLQQPGWLGRHGTRGGRRPSRGDLYRRLHRAGRAGDAGGAGAVVDRTGSSPCGPGRRLRSRCGRRWRPRCRSRRVPRAHHRAAHGRRLRRQASRSDRDRGGGAGQGSRAAGAGGLEPDRGVHGRRAAAGGSDRRGRRGDAAGELSGWTFLDVNAGRPGIATPYRVADYRIEYQPAHSPLAAGFLPRPRGHGQQLRQGIDIDELPPGSGIDPVEFRLRNLADERLADVLRAVAERVGWHDAITKRDTEAAAERRSAGALRAGSRRKAGSRPLPDRGLDPGGQVRVTRLVSGYECGAIVNPRAVRAQVEGAAVMALGGALSEAVTFAGGGSPTPGSPATGCQGSRTCRRSMSSCLTGRTCRRPEPGRPR